MEDRSVYVIANATLVAILVCIISFLFSSVTKTNMQLSEKVGALHLAFEEVYQQKNYIKGIFNVIAEGFVTINHEYLESVL